MAIKMLRRKDSVEDIMDITELSRESIEKLAEENGLDSAILYYLP